MSHIRKAIAAVRSALAERAGLLRVAALFGSAVLLTAATPNAAQACGITDIGSCVALIIIKIFQLLTALMGWIMVLEVDALIRVAQYQNFVSPGPSAVQIGWVVTRDLANMFFIIILLIIAFGTILGSSTYHYKQNLKILLIMAVVINFSKTICGIFIDMGQVVMLTFVNGFKEAAAGNFVNAFQINKLLELGDRGGSYTFGMAVAMIFAFILTTIAVNVLLVMLVTLIFRVVALWVLIILSPIAFLARAIPSANTYYAQWWGEFKKYIITGPIIAFFLWLALASVQHAAVNGGGLVKQGFGASSTASSAESAAATQVGDSSIPTEAGASSDVIMNLIIAICLMFYGLKVAGSSGVAGVGMANAIRNRALKYGRAIGTGGAKLMAEPLMRRGGAALAKVPLIGGLGRAAALKGESWKKARQARIEKFAGTPEDMARLSPSAFARKVGGLKDPTELDRYMKAAQANPAAMAALTKTSTSTNPLTGVVTKSSPAKDALRNLVAAGKGAEAAKLISSDKRLGELAKGDLSLMSSVYGGLKDAADKNPNLKKDVGDFEQKFLSTLLQKDDNGNVLLGNVNKDKLEAMAPKISNDDLGNMDGESIAALFPYLKGGQMKKLMQDGKADQISGAAKAFGGMQAGEIQKKLTAEGIKVDDIHADLFANEAVADYVLDKSRGSGRGDVVAKDVGGHLQRRADARLGQAMADMNTADPQKKAEGTKAFLNALPDAISVGSLTASKIATDADLQTAIRQNANQIDLNALGRNVSVTNAGKTEAGKALASLIGDVVPDKVKNARKGGMNDHILPTVSEMESKAVATRNVTRDAYVADALSGALATAIAGQVSQLRGVGADDRADELNQLFQKVKDTTDQLKNAQGQLTAAEQKLANSAGMSASQLQALQSAAESLKKRVDELKGSVASAAAETKGEKYDSGKQNRRNRP